MINYELFIIMIKGKVRFEIHNILFSIYKLNLTLNNNSIKKLLIGKKEKILLYCIVYVKLYEISFTLS